MPLFSRAQDWISRLSKPVEVLRRRGSRHGPTVLMYHGILPRRLSAVGFGAVDRDGFARQMRLLKRHCRIIHPGELEGATRATRADWKQAVLITFDDGFANNATIAWPILEEMKIPAIFFVSTRHMEAGKYLWFAHARALFQLWPAGTIQLLGRPWTLGDAGSRQHAVEEFMTRTRSVPIEAVYRDLADFPVSEFVPPGIVDEELRGMTAAELAAVAKSPLITIGAHTCNHPYLTRCPQSQVQEEITAAKLKLEEICGRPVTAFAYPDGDYDDAVASIVRQAGFNLAFAVDPRNQTTERQMAIPRTGIYRPGLGLFAAKTYGLV